jgi:hypothetical protein
LNNIFKQQGSNSVENSIGVFMKNHFLLNLLIFLLVNNNNFLQSQQLNQEYQNLLKEIENVKPILEAAVPDSGIIIKQHDAVFNLKSGNLYRFDQIAGAERLFLFKGDGQFIFAPPSQIEKDQLFRFYEKHTLDEEFDYLVLILSDISKLKLPAEIVFTPITSSYALNSNFQKFLDYTLDDEIGYFDTDFMTSFLNNHTNSLFYAHIGLTHGDPVFLKFSPYDREEVTFLKKRDVGFILSSDYQEVISSYSLQKPDDNEKILKEDAIEISDYKIISKIEDNLDFSAKCEINFERKYTNTKWIKFDLYYDLLVDSVFLDDQKTFDYYRGEENYELWIKLNPFSANNKITVYYNGDLLEKDELDWIAIKSPDYWFPKYSTPQDAMCDLTFIYPAKYKLVSIGKKESEEEDDDFITCRWKSIEPTKHASFNIGYYEKFELQDDRNNKVNVFISKSGHQKLASTLVEYGTLSGADMDEKIATDVLASIQFFKGVIGPIPLNELQVTEIPYLHGQAFPGLIHLSFANYQGIMHDKDDEIFRAHEVAHQWWGIGVDVGSYHDYWLGEGFATYSSLWFVQAAFHDNDVFFKVLDRWKDEIFNNRKYLFGSGQEAGPIWLGIRTNTSDTEGDYNLIIYKKGAWVLHMLRNMMIDLKTMKEDPFQKMIKEFYKTYYGKKATTEDFKKITEKYCGMDMTWFFNQFVYGTELPTYNFSYTSEKTEEGKVIVKCKIITENVSEDFKMYVPLTIKFSGDRFARIRIEVKGKESMVKLPVLPEVPEEIIFNDLNSVLCKVEYD